MCRGGRQRGRDGVRGRGWCKRSKGSGGGGRAWGRGGRGWKVRGGYEGKRGDAGRVEGRCGRKV